MAHSYRRMPGAFHVVNDTTHRVVAQYGYKNDAEKNAAWQKTLDKIRELDAPSMWPEKKPAVPSVPNRQAPLTVDGDYEWAVTAKIFTYIRTSSENFEIRTYSENTEPHNSFLINFRGNDFRVMITKV